MRSRTVIAVAAAGALAVVAILVVVIAGMQAVPEFSDLAGSGETGYVAYASGESEPPTSVRIVDLSSRETVEVSMPREGEAAGWDEDGNLMVVQWGPTLRVKHVDPATGEQVGEIEELDGEFADPMQREDVWVTHQDGRLVLERTDGQTASFAAPDSYQVTNASSMGEDHVVFVDELGRVAVCPVGEDVTPVQVADDAQPWFWVTART